MVVRYFKLNHLIDVILLSNWMLVDYFIVPVNRTDTHTHTQNSKRPIGWIWSAISKPNFRVVFCSLLLRNKNLFASTIGSHQFCSINEKRKKNRFDCRSDPFEKSQLNELIYILAKTCVRIIRVLKIVVLIETKQDEEVAAYRRIYIIHAYVM